MKAKPAFRVLTFLLYSVTFAFAGITALSSTPTNAATVPDPPTNVMAKQAGPCLAEDSVSWTAPSSNGGSAITGYKVTAVQDTSKHCSTTGALTCIVPDLTLFVFYSFTVTATNAIGTSLPSQASDSVRIIVTLTGAAPPLNVIATADNAQATVSWNESLCGGGPYLNFEHFQVTFLCSDSVLCTTIAQACTITGLTNGKSYVFVVTAVYLMNNSYNTYGVSSPSDTVTPSSSLALKDIPAFPPRHRHSFNRFFSDDDTAGVFRKHQSIGYGYFWS